SISLNFASAGRANITCVSQWTGHEHGGGVRKKRANWPSGIERWHYLLPGDVERCIRSIRCGGKPCNTARFKLASVGISAPWRGRSAVVAMAVVVAHGCDMQPGRLGDPATCKLHR